MGKVLFALFTIVCFTSVNAFIEFEISRNAFDTDLYENVLDEELCEEQLSYIVNNNTMLRAECKFMYLLIDQANFVSFFL